MDDRLHLRCGKGEVPEIALEVRVWLKCSASTPEEVREKKREDGYLMCFEKSTLFL